MRLFRLRERPPVDPMLQALNDECERWGDVLWYNRNRKGSQEAEQALGCAVEGALRRRAYVVSRAQSGNPAQVPSAEGRAPSKASREIVAEALKETP